MVFEEVSPLCVVAATLEDERYYWEVNNDEAVRAQSLRTEPIPFESHQAWFRARVGQHATRLYVARLGDARCGVSRLDAGDAPTAMWISLALNGAFRGRGLASKIIALTSEHAASMGAKQVRAHVRPTNVASAKAFSRAGFVEVLRTKVNEVDVHEWMLVVAPS